MCIGNGHWTSRHEMRSIENLNGLSATVSCYECSMKAVFAKNADKKYFVSAFIQSHVSANNQWLLSAVKTIGIAVERSLSHFILEIVNFLTWACFIKRFQRFPSFICSNIPLKPLKAKVFVFSWHEKYLKIVCAHGQYSSAQYQLDNLSVSSISLLDQ